MTAQQTFYFQEDPYLQVLQGLHSALSEPEAFVKLIGGAQTGKSLLCAKLTQYMRRKGYQVVYFNAAVESPEMLRTVLARELKLPVSSNFSRLLEDTLQPRDGKPIILIFDDAHLLTDITLLEIYRLAEVQVNQSRVLNVLLSGDLSLEKRLLSNREFKSLLLNVSNRFVLEPMDRATMDQFFYRYAEKSGVPGLQLDVAAMNYLYKSCRGYPGPALSMCRLILESRSGSTDMKPVSKNELILLLRSAADQGLTGNTFRDFKKIKMLAPLAAVVAIASLGFMYQQLVPGEQFDDSATFIAREIPQGEQNSPFEDVAAASGTSDIEVEPGEDVTAGEDAALTIAEPANANNPDAIAATAAAPVPPAPRPIDIPEPVSDSSLALVTAEEIGVSTEAISEPVFEALMPEEQLDTVEVLEFEAQPEPAEEIAELEPVAVPATPGAELPVQSSDTEQVPQINIAPPEAVVLDEIEEETLVVEPADPLEESATIPAEEEPGLSLASQLETSVQLWLTAWESQTLDEYFASYHSQFNPRYQDDIASWRSNRQRVIGNASSIELEMSDFEHVGVEEGLQDVRFWLRYRSPNYSDNTQKKLLMEEEEGSWKIVEEINLQVTR